MSPVLAIDTAGPVIGVAVHRGPPLPPQEVTVRITRGAEEILPTLVDQACAQADVELRALVGIGVASGPGAFTGLRVGMAAAAGLAFALGVPVWTTNSLLPRAQAAGQRGRLLVMLDARKSRVYAAAWDGTALTHPPGDVPPEEALAWVSGAPFRATGEGAEVYRALVEASGGVVHGSAERPGTAALAALAAAGLARGEGIDAVTLQAEYLRDADAVPRDARPR
ncbi:MAG: tRNA (adenosine(37)-N6)-threonylcarbamoyltransferase complex dimerization subunit type 1 TsaB [Myxococcota bacterium]